MSFLDCINTAVASGKIKAEKGQEALDAFDRAVKEGLSEGLSEQAARDAASYKAVEYMGAKTQARKWEKIAEVRAQHRLYKMVQDAEDMNNMYVELGDRTEVVQRRISAMMSAKLSEFVEQSRPRYSGIIHPVKHEADVVKAAFGGATSNPTNKEIADSIKDLMDFTRMLANRQGASIPENKNVFLPQAHNTFKVSRIKPTMEESKAEWVKDQLEWLDWEVMRYHGEKIAVTDREEVLGKIFETITSRGDINIKPGLPSERLTERMARQRFLYYKDADGWLANNDKYGEGNLFQQTIGYMESMSRDIGLMEVFGPNPGASISFLHKAAKARAAALDQAPDRKGTSKSQASKVDKSISRFNDQYRLLSRDLPNSDESLLANFSGTARTLVSSVLLTKAFIANLGDLVLMKHTANMNNLPMTGQIRSYLKFMKPSKANRALAIRSGLGAEGFTNVAQSVQRAVGPLEGGAWAKRFSDSLMRATILNAHTTAAKWGWGFDLQGKFADMAKLPYEQLPMVEQFKARGITKDDWDLFRKQATYDPKGVNLLRPVDLFNNTEGDARANKVVAEKFWDFILDTRRFAVPEADSRTLSIAGHTADPRTWVGQLVKSANMFMSFPITMMAVHMRRGMQMPTVAGRAAYLSSFFLSLTTVGAFITQMKELVQGRDPLDMQQPEFWVRAALNGGSFGILGDAILGKGDLSSEASGALIDFYGDVKKLSTAAVLATADKISGAQNNRRLPGMTADAIVKYGPWPWYMELIFRRKVADELLRQADPAAYRRKLQMQQRRELELNQRSWWASGQSGPTRAPDWGAAWGGSRR